MLPHLHKVVRAAVGFGRDGAALVRRRRGRGCAYAGRGGFTLIEILVALALMCMLLAAVASAVQGMCNAYTENVRIAEVTQAARVVLYRLVGEARAAEAIEITPCLTMTPPANAANITLIKYELINGTLWYRQTINGVETSTAIIPASGDVHVEDFHPTRETGVDAETGMFTRSMTVRLQLRVGSNPLVIKASACPRRNLTF